MAALKLTESEYNAIEGNTATSGRKRRHDAVESFEGQSGVGGRP